MYFFFNSTIKCEMFLFRIIRTYNWIIQADWWRKTSCNEKRQASLLAKQMIWCLRDNHLHLIDSTSFCLIYINRNICRSNVFFACTHMFSGLFSQPLPQQHCEMTYVQIVFSNKKYNFLFGGLQRIWVKINWKKPLCKDNVIFVIYNFPRHSADKCNLLHGFSCLSFLRAFFVVIAVSKVQLKCLRYIVPRAIFLHIYLLIAKLFCWRLKNSGTGFLLLLTFCCCFFHFACFFLCAMKIQFEQNHLLGITWSRRTYVCICAITMRAQNTWKRIIQNLCLWNDIDNICSLCSVTSKNVSQNNNEVFFSRSVLAKTAKNERNSNTKKWE